MREEGVKSASVKSWQFFLGTTVWSLSPQHFPPYCFSLLPFLS